MRGRLQNDDRNNSSSSEAGRSRIRGRRGDDGARVQQLVAGKGRLVEVPYTASVRDTLHSMLAHNIVAVAVAAPPGHWIGAGGSMIVESDRVTGAARKQYIGIVSTLDVLFHLAELSNGAQVPTLLAGTRVSTIIGHCLEGLSLWAIAPHTSVMEAMDFMSKGLHRALVPLESQMKHTLRTSGSPLEAEESAVSYRMLTQTDLMQFLHSKLETLHPIVCQSVDKNDVGHRKAHSGSFLANDLRGCSVESFQEWAREGVLRFLRWANVTRKFGVGGAVLGTNQLHAQAACNMVDSSCTTSAADIPFLTCYPSSTLEYVTRSALEQRVHRVWVVDRHEQQQGQLLVGFISFSDILRTVRQQVEAAPPPPSYY
ncbi:hypothetical protein GOP47_0012102 [Adiantum capillus-veneris]|uniref:CBS domain-containing protein n=1 Tax=Adiantum capillus-veneris TaxID=13818 RepID=A0A9D4ZGK3_ADICA|nr:hypothetical protein GOP47_0012102 [Adiantum capillus-veneris]